MNEVLRLLDAVEAVGKYPHFKGYCPVHSDKSSGGNRSLDIDFEDKGIGVVEPWLHCRSRSCGANGTKVANALGFEWPRIMLATPAFVAGHPPIGPRRWKLPSGAMFARWSKGLLKSDEPLRWLMEERGRGRGRGLTLDVIEHYQIGLDAERRRFLFPIFVWPTEPPTFLNPCIVNALWYPLDEMADGRRKMCCWGGWETDLYPGVPTTPWVLVTEGELDALVALSHRIPAVSGTTGAGHWESRWTSSFADRSVVIAYDCDKAGRAGAQAVAAELRTVARSVRIVDLDPSRHNGYDLTDWFRDGRTVAELRALIQRTRLRI